MNWRIALTLSLVTLGCGPVVAQQTAPAVIRVIGNGSVETAPDIAVVTFALRGEGATSDDAVRALVATRGPIERALAGKAELRTGRLAINAARDKACDASDGDYDAKLRLSTGPCAIRGYVASLAVTARVRPVAEAGTLLGLIGRLGAVDPSLREFAVSEPGPAQTRAVAAAIVDARRQAEAIATATGVTLGRLRRVDDQRASNIDANEVMVTASRAPQDQPVVAPPPIAVALSPEPVETTATLTVEFEIGGPRS